MTLTQVTSSTASKAIILGSGVNVLEGQSPQESIPYAEIPGWPLGSVKGHKGVLDIYEDIWVLRGRAHIYEGHSWQAACYPTGFLAESGIKELIVTNSAGGINPDYEIGDLMQITGYLNFMLPTRPRGGLPALLEPVTKFDTELIKDDSVYKGVYVGVHGPNYESDAEVGLFRSMGGDAVGMSTIPEIETALGFGMKVTAVSIITNVYGKTEDLGHEGVLAVAKQASNKLVGLLGLQ